jgi:hypothetical protein
MVAFGARNFGFRAAQLQRSFAALLQADEATMMLGSVVRPRRAPSLFA